ncbi:hypothetical protein [Paludisphaera sp.]|uniref:hypothetical protein n=1 Tax=Paludisphaera sp. TaxID=2017432 RepID=UPI00301C1E37
MREWLGRELDPSGAPVGLPLAEWALALQALAESRRGRAGWPEDLDARVIGFVRALLRFSRPGGATATARDIPPAPRAFWGEIAKAFPAEDVGRVLSWWSPRRGDDPGHVPPPPGWSATDRTLGVLRADWTARGDLLAFDQREGSTTRFELFGSGVSWLGPRWWSASDGSEAPAEATARESGVNADVAEWSFRSGGREVTRLALMLHGRKLALLADLHDAGDATMGLEVPAGLTHEDGETPGSATLRPGKAGRSARAILMTPGRAEFDEGARRVWLSGASRWLPLLVSWDHARNRKRLAVVELTVAEGGKRCPSDVAWAARASWGLGETFVFYRSLGPTARRSFLGCSTTARLLVGRFTPEGDVEPIATLD